MSSRHIRVLCLLVAIGAGAATGFFLKSIDTAIVGERAAADALRDRARALATALTDVRAGQAAFVAPGQGGDFWTGRVSKLLPAVDQQMSEFKGSLTSPAAQADLEPASAALENLHKLNARAQEYVKSGDMLMASDLIFSDGIEAMSTAETQVEAALRDELQARDAVTVELRAREITALAAGAGVILIALLVLGLTGGADQLPEPMMPTIARDVVKTVTPAPMPVTVKTRVPNIAIAAQLCTDLARVLETKQLPALLERTAKVINATGIIVWMADPAGKELRPAMSFGYSDQLVARMGTIPSDATNAAAAAYRAAEARTVAGEGSKNGALVTPILTAEGCIGVISAEMKGGSEKDESSQALASIVAAQLATLLAPSPASLPQAAQA